MSDMTMEELMPDSQQNVPEQTQSEADASSADRSLKSAIEAIIYVASEPVSVEQIAKAVDNTSDAGDIEKARAATRTAVIRAIAQLQQEYQMDARGIEIREIAGGYKMFTKPEHHDTVRRFVKSLAPPLRLSMAALETLATIAYRQPLTAPEIQAVRGVQGTGVLKTLLDRKLIHTAGRKNVIGKPILYKTTREFLVQFGLGSVSDLPSMEEFEAVLKASFGELGGDIGEPTLPLEENVDGGFTRGEATSALADAGEDGSDSETKAEDQNDSADSDSHAS